MSQELWATYSVDDHLNPRALATDMMLFDRLVFPVPETPQNTGNLERGPVEWKRNPAEWARWTAKGWDPDGQKQLLDLLQLDPKQSVVRKVPWGRGSPVYDQYDQYRSEAAKVAAEGLPDYAFVATPTF